MTGARVGAVVGFIAAGMAACSTTLNLPDGEEPAIEGGTDGGADGEAGDADTSLDGMSNTEAGADADAETGPNGPKPFTVTNHTGTTLLGVAATATSLFFTEPALAPASPGKIWSVNLSPPNVETAVSAFEFGLGAIKVTGADEIRWGKGINGNIDVTSGVFKSALNGTFRQAATAADVPSCRGFAYSPPNIHHCAIAGTGEIRRVDGAIVITNWVSGGGANIFIDSYTNPGPAPVTFVVWTELTSIRTSDATASTSAGGLTILANISPVGVAVKYPWVYFTQTTGSIDRVRLDGSSHTTLFVPPTPPANIADITVAIDGMHVYWAQGTRIMGLAVVP